MHSRQTDPNALLKRVLDMTNPPNQRVELPIHNGYLKQPETKTLSDRETTTIFMDMPHICLIGKCCDKPVAYLSLVSG